MTTTMTKMLGSCNVVDVSKLFVSDLNSRFQKQESETSEAFVWLCESIKSEGLVEPIIVRPVGNQYEVIAGTRRFAALKHIGMRQALVVVKEMNDNDVRIASLIENIHRLDLSEDEKEYTLREIYLNTWDEWKPDFPLTIVDEHRKKKTYEKEDFEDDNKKIFLARQYVQKIHNDNNRKSENLSKVLVKPTEAFKKLSSRVGYAPGYQVNILRGYGAISGKTDYYEELPPTLKEKADQAAKEQKLKEQEKKELAKRMFNTYKTPEQPRKQKTRIQKVEATIQRFKKEKQREAIKQIHRQEQKLVEARKQQAKTEHKPPVNPKVAQESAVRLVEEILGVGHKLFTALTGQQITGADTEVNELLAENAQATSRMEQLVLFSEGIAAQQHVVIPLCIALEKYRDILYDAVESRKRKDEMGRP